MSILYEPMAPAPTVLQRLRIIDAGVWLLIYSVFMLCSDFSLFQRALLAWFSTHPDVTINYVRAQFVICSLLIIAAAWFEKRVPLLVAKGYVAVLTVFSIVVLGYALIGSLLDRNFNREIRKLLDHNATVPIHVFHNLGYIAYFAVDTFQVTAAYALHLLLIHHALKSSTKATSSMLRRVQRVDIRVWFVVFAVATWAGDTLLAESILMHGLREFQVYYLLAMLFSFFVLYTAFTNKMWALKVIKFGSLVVIGYLSITIIILLSPIFIFLRAQDFTPSKVLYFFLSFSGLHILVLTLLTWTAQWWLVKKVMVKVEEEKKVNMEMEDIV